jgi:hypothetical protein
VVEAVPGRLAVHRDGQGEADRGDLLGAGVVGDRERAGDPERPGLDRVGVERPDRDQLPLLGDRELPGRVMAAVGQRLDPDDMSGRQPLPLPVPDDAGTGRGPGPG